MNLVAIKHVVQPSRWRCSGSRSLILTISAALVLSACASADATDSSEATGAAQIEHAPVATVTRTASMTEGHPKVLFVLLDGTRNDASSLTNVYLMKQAIEASSLPAMVLYSEGVGSRSDPPLLGPALGFGMEARINQGYRFLSEQHRSGDRIVIMGFSRGAHQARALAGLVAYAGLLDVTGMDERRQAKSANEVIEAVKVFTDEQVAPDWLEAPDEPPKMASLSRSLKLRIRAAPIDFLGVWDTVPGSSFKSFGQCRELPDRRPGERYKTGSYPGIARIAHAVALDEMRSMFRPILLCPPLMPEQTTVREAWFAGAHADVGGGYGPAANSLSRVSMAWMADELSAALGMSIGVSAPSEADALAPAHWSMGDAPANLRSHCARRAVPEGAQVHPSVEPRRRIGMAPLMVKGVLMDVPYPFSCEQMETAR